MPNVKCCGFAVLLTIPKVADLIFIQRVHIVLVNNDLHNLVVAYYDEGSLTCFVLLDLITVFLSETIEQRHILHVFQ